MKYLQRSFSCPASHNTSDIQWDFAFLTKKEFIKKHGEALWNKLSVTST